jgi:hypothetical protein
MPQTYKILGQATVSPNTLTNVYVTGASTSAVVNSIYICNQGVNSSNVQIILRPINESLSNRHVLIKDETVGAAATLVLNLGITMGSNMILAANTTFTGQLTPVPTGVSTFSYGTFGLEIT